MVAEDGIEPPTRDFQPHSVFNKISHLPCKPCILCQFDRCWIGMPTISQELRDRVQQVLDDGPSPRYPMDDEAAAHGAIAIWGTLGMIVGLRPDGTLWQFDAEWGAPLAPVPPEHQVSVLANGTKRFPWLAEALPPRPAAAVDCESCLGHRFFGPTRRLGHYQARASAKDELQSIVCSRCQGLGWIEN